MVDRFAQLEPSVFIPADGYRYGGKDHDRTPDVKQAREALPTLETTIVVPRLGVALDGLPGVLTWDEATVRADLCRYRAAVAASAGGL